MNEPSLLVVPWRICPTVQSYRVMSMSMSLMFGPPVDLWMGTSIVFGICSDLFLSISVGTRKNVDTNATCDQGNTNNHRVSLLENPLLSLVSGAAGNRMRVTTLGRGRVSRCMAGSFALAVNPVYEPEPCDGLVRLWKRDGA